MKTGFPISKIRRRANALMLTMIMSGIALAILAGAMTWSMNSTRLTRRSIQYSRSIVAAEAATEKVLSRLTSDFQTGGEKLVEDNLSLYRQTVPTSADSAFWSHWNFDDGLGSPAQTFVERGAPSSYIVLNSAYAGLHGYASTYSIVSHAAQNDALQKVVGGVLQEVQLARIPVFQFAMYSSGDMEISCGQPFTVTGRVHSNGKLFVEPDSLLTFGSDVTAVGDILFQRSPLDERGSPVGGAVYVYPDRKVSPVAALTLPIGTTNTPEAIREIIQPSPLGESPNSPMGRLRYCNQSELIITVTDAATTATSGGFDGFMTAIPNSEAAQFVSTASTFQDAREGKTVWPIDLDIGRLTAWSATNSNLRAALGAKDVSSVYVRDQRTLSGSNMGAVRVVNGLLLPPRGLTVSTARPLYVLGNYNQMVSANLGTGNTVTTRPASLVGDAITILSTNWQDANSALPLSSRTAGSTTVNAALLTGVVETFDGHYSGGMENFPRFLESWGSANVFTYNGSMVKMFPSLFATNIWGLSGVYAPPKRNWAFDVNFDDPTKLPPLTPGLQKMIRARWATVAPDKNSAAFTF